MHHRLLRVRGFLPYLAVVLINAMIDLGHKIVIQNTVFKCYSGTTQIALTALVNACILLPFILFFTPAGFLADRFSKNTVIRWTASMAIPLTILIYFSYIQGWFEAAFALTLILAAQSAFYSPAKYGYIKEMVGSEKLGLANGVVQAVTIVAILLGGVIFSLVFEALIGEAQTREDILRAIAPCGVLLIIGAVAQSLVSLRIPPRKSGDATIRLDRSKYLHGKYLKQNLKKLHHTKIIWLSVLGLSMFWAVNQVLFAAFGAHLKDMAGVTSTVVAQGLLAIGGVGIIAGSVTAGRLSRTHIETGLIPVGALGMTVCLALIPGIAHTPTLGLLLAVYGFFGGVFVVPLNALIQFNAKESELGTILAGNNFVQNVAMLGFLVLTVLASLTGLSSVPIISALALIVALGSLFTLRQLPQSFMRFLLRAVFAQRYRLAVSGLEHIPSQGGVLLLGNHTSWIDWAVLHLAVPRPVRFVMTRKYYDRWYLRWFLDLYRVIPISTTASSAALKTIIQTLRDGECVVLFPEGAISRNGQLGAFRRGYSIPATQTGCPIVPFYLRGLWGSRWSMVNRHFRRTSNGGRVRDVGLCFGPTLPPTATPLQVKAAVHRLSVLAWQEFAATRTSIPDAWLRAIKRAPGRLAVADSSGVQYAGDELVLTCVRLARKLRGIDASAVGIMLPPGVAAIVANMAALMAGKTVINLDPTLDEDTVNDCLRQANVSTILTHASPRETPPVPPTCTTIRVETPPVKALHRLATRIALCVVPVAALRRLIQTVGAPDQPAAVVFTKRSTPGLTGVCLSHAGIIANVRQITSLFPPKGDDIILTALPLHLCQGLTLGLFLPLLESIPLICHHDGSQAQTMGRLCLEYEATILHATPTTLEAFVHNPRLHPLMLASLRTVFCSGRPLSETCAEAFRHKFGIMIHEGYGTTETTPAATVNAPDALNAADLSVQQGRKPGTVGLPLPGAALRIVDPQTLDDLPHGQSGRILIGGTQLMQGYLNDPERTAKVLVERDGIRWFVTGDLGHLDEDGFLILENDETPSGGFPPDGKRELRS